MQTPDTRNSLRDIVQLIIRRRALFFLGTLAFAILALIVSHFIPLEYTGKAVFEFGLEAAASQISKAGEAAFGTIKERLVHDGAGYQAVEQAIEGLGLTEGLPRGNDGNLTYEGQARLQEMVEKFMEDIEVTWEARSEREDLVLITFTHKDSALARDMPNTLVRNYVGGFTS